MLFFFFQFKVYAVEYLYLNTPKVSFCIKKLIYHLRDITKVYYCLLKTIFWEVELLNHFKCRYVGSVSIFQLSSLGQELPGVYNYVKISGINLLTKNEV